MDFRKGVGERVRCARRGVVTRRGLLISGCFGRTVREVCPGWMGPGYTLGDGVFRTGYGPLGADGPGWGAGAVGVLCPWRPFRASRGAGASNSGFRGSGACFGPLRGWNWHFDVSCWCRFPAWLQSFLRPGEQFGGFSSGPSGVEAGAGGTPLGRVPWRCWWGGAFQPF